MFSTIAEQVLSTNKPTGAIYLATKYIYSYTISKHEKRTQILRGQYPGSVTNIFYGAHC